MKEYHEENVAGLLIAHDLRDDETAKKLELLRGGLPEKYTEIEVVTEDLAMLHIYPGAALDLLPGGVA